MNFSRSIRWSAPGLILWLPKGAVIRRQLENFLYDKLLEIGYQPVYTPHIGRIELYQTSGHFPYYADSQFPPLYFHPLGGVIQELLQLWAKGEIDDDGPAARLEPYMHSCALPDPSERAELRHAAIVEREGDGDRIVAGEAGAVSLEADELPAPYQDLPERSRGAIASCRCGWRSSARSTASSSRASSMA